MDTLNANFVSVRDLDDIDAVINAVSDQKLQVTRAVQAKNDPLAQSDSANIAPLLATINSVATPAEADAAMARHGSIRVLAQLKALLAQRAQLQRDSEVYHAAAQLEAKLNAVAADTPVLALQEWVREADAIADDDARAALRARLYAVTEARRALLSAQLAQLLQDIKWLSPKEKVLIPADKLKQIAATFDALVALQAVCRVPEYPDVWWALQVLLQPYTVRFAYHFGQASGTNKISRPEWALGFVEKFLAENLPALELVIDASFHAHGKIGVFETISAVLVPLREKLLRMVDTINTRIEQSHDDVTALDLNGKLLSHLIFETAAFDQRLRTAYKYNPYITDLALSPTRKWMGLIGDIMLVGDDESAAVNNWLSLELRLAKKRFGTEIVGPANAFEIDYDFNASSDSPQQVLKPSYSAYGLVKLFDNLTTHFKTISILKYQWKYVSMIQLTFLAEYLDHLQQQFAHFNESLSLKLISNFLPGVKAADTTTQTIVTNGLKGLEVLTGLYCLLKFVLMRMEEWSELLVFIQLWDYYRTENPDKEENSVFEASEKQYKALLLKVINKYEDFFRKEVRSALKEYVNTSQWNIADADHKNQVSPQLANVVASIPAYMSYLKRTLPEVDYFLVSSKVCDSLANILREYVITNNQFNKNGVDQLRTDVDFLSSQMEQLLLLEADRKYSNHSNKSYNKVLQSIEMMSYFDAAGAKVLKKQFDNADGIRSQFDSHLDCLTDSDCLDLLFRIV